MREIERRLSKLEKGSGAKFARVAALIESGKYYDELTEDEKWLYREYYEAEGLKLVADYSDCPEFLELLKECGINEAGRFKLVYRPKMPTRQDILRTAEEIEKYFEELQENEV